MDASNTQQLEDAGSPNPAATPAGSCQPFQTILFGPGDTFRSPPDMVPDFFGDINLDKVVAGMTSGKEPYDLAVFFYQSLTDLDAVAWRHEVFHDLEKPPVAAAIRAFAAQMHSMQGALVQAEKFYYRHQRESWVLDAAAGYTKAIATLADTLQNLEITSRGLRGLRDWLAEYRTGADFGALCTRIKDVRAGLAGIQYELLIRGPNVVVRKYEEAPDYSLAVARTFEKFQQGQTSDSAKDMPDFIDMNHIEAGILELVAKLFVPEFRALDDFQRDWGAFADPLIIRFNREIQFYLAVLEHIEPLRQAGLAFCYPVLDDNDKTISVSDCFDLALADKLTGDKMPIVTNSFELGGTERIIVVSGPNQGGKTTFARMFGQLHFLAALGCPVPGRKARLFLFDRMFTHFEREETITSKRGKLEDDLVRIHRILKQATPRSIILINEIFTSTTLSDAILLGEKILAKIIALDLLCVCVTFIDELARPDPKIVSMSSTVVPTDPAQRTFKIIRKPADGNAFAAFLAKRYGLTISQITERIAP